MVENDDKIKIVTERKLILLLAKYIKNCCREKRNTGRIVIGFPIKYEAGFTFFLIGNEWYRYNGRINREGVIKKSLEETPFANYYVCKDYETDGYLVIVYAKPVNEFNSLSRLIYRSTGVTINWYDVRTIYPDNPAWNRYLSYNPIKCQEIISFIKTHKKTRDIVYAGFVCNNDNNCNMKQIILSIADEHCREKVKEIYKA